MKLLFDTHAYFWWETNNPKLSGRARDAIANNEDDIFVSAVTAWELATKARIGGWPDAEPSHGISKSHSVKKGFCLYR